MCVSVSVPEQAGGASEADERSAHQNVRATGRGGARPGDHQPQAGAGQPHGPGKDPEVRRACGTGTSGRSAFEPG